MANQGGLPGQGADLGLIKPIVRVMMLLIVYIINLSCSNQLFLIHKNTISLYNVIFLNSKKIFWSQCSIYGLSRRDFI